MRKSMVLAACILGFSFQGLAEGSKPRKSFRKPDSVAASIMIQGEHARFLYDLAEKMRDSADEVKENEASFAGGCIYDVNVKKMRIKLQFCEGYMGRITDRRLAKSFSEILLTHLPLEVHELFNRFAGGPWSCNRPSKTSKPEEYKCEFKRA